MKYTISYQKNARREDLQILSNGIMQHAKQHKELHPLEFFAFFIRDELGQIKGGCNGNSLYGCLYIDQLWITESLRGKGYGSELMLQAEQWGKDHHCTFATVNTMDWEALDFYRILGYYIEFERYGFEKN